MKHPLAIGTRIVSHHGEMDTDGETDEERHAAPGEIGEIVSVDSMGYGIKNYGVVFYPSGVWVFIESKELEVESDYAVLDTVEDELTKLVSSYVEVMEDYDAGYIKITNPDHPHHEDWMRASKILGWLAARKRLNDEAEDTP